MLRFDNFVGIIVIVIRFRQDPPFQTLSSLTTISNYLFEYFIYIIFISFFVSDLILYCLEIT